MLNEHKKPLATIVIAEKLARHIHANAGDLIPIRAARELLKQARRQVRERISYYEQQERVCLGERPWS